MVDQLYRGLLNKTPVMIETKLQRTRYFRISSGLAYFVYVGLLTFVPIVLVCSFANEFIVNRDGMGIAKRLVIFGLLCWGCYRYIKEVTLGLSLCAVVGDSLVARSLLKKQVIPLQSIVDIGHEHNVARIAVMVITFNEGETLHKINVPIDGTRKFKISKRYIERCRRLDETREFHGR